MGSSLGAGVGSRVGLFVGVSDGTAVGCLVGVCDGVNDGSSVVGGSVVGAKEGDRVGGCVGASVGVSDGTAVGCLVGVGVGASVSVATFVETYETYCSTKCVAIIPVFLGDRHNPDVIDIQLDVVQDFTLESNANVGVLSVAIKFKFEPAMVIEAPPVCGPLGGP